MSIRWNVSCHCITLIFVQHVEVCKKRLSIYTNDLSFANRACGLNKDFISTQKLNTETLLDTERWTQIDGHRNWKSLCYITTSISCIWKWNWNERETDTETQRHLFFVYCHIVWRLQLLDDLHLVGLPLDHAKVTKQLWKERSREEIWYLTNMFYHISINIKDFLSTNLDKYYINRKSEFKVCSKFGSNFKVKI